MKGFSALTIAVACWDAATTTVINRARAIANTACVQRANTRIYIVTNAIVVSICSARASANAEGVQLVAVAIAFTFRDVAATAVINRARPVANTTSVKRANARINVVTNAIVIRIGGARTPANAYNILHCATAIFDVRGRVIIARGWIRATQYRTRITQTAKEQLLIHGHIVRIIPPLHIHHTRNVTRTGVSGIRSYRQLCNQHLLVITSNRGRRSAWYHKPRCSYSSRHDHILSEIECIQGVRHSNSRNGSLIR